MLQGKKTMHFNRLFGISQEEWPLKGTKNLYIYSRKGSVGVCRNDNAGKESKQKVSWWVWTAACTVCNVQNCNDCYIHSIWLRVPWTHKGLYSASRRETSSKLSCTNSPKHNWKLKFIHGLKFVFFRDKFNFTLVWSESSDYIVLQSQTLIKVLLYNGVSQSVSWGGNFMELHYGRDALQFQVLRT